MAPRTYWKGTLKLSLVACPVVLYPASTSVEKTRFHMINRETGNRLKQQMIDRGMSAEAPGHRVVGRSARDESGFGLLELLMAIVMLNVGILAIVAAFSSGSTALARASRISTAAALANARRAGVAERSTPMMA